MPHKSKDDDLSAPVSGEQARIVRILTLQRTIGKQAKANTRQWLRKNANLPSLFVEVLDIFNKVHCTLDSMLAPARQKQVVTR